MKNTEAKAGKKKVPIEPGLFTIPSSPAEPPHLIGSKCPACGEVVFPRQIICPHCCREGTEEILLSTRGTVYSSTIVHYPPQLYTGPLPYADAQVLLPEGVLIPTVLTNCSLEKPVEIGTEVELVLEKFGEDEEGNEVLMYKFKVLQ
jgi:hypothetical protein